jgi:hypothetical protein
MNGKTLPLLLAVFLREEIFTGSGLIFWPNICRIEKLKGAFANLFRGACSFWVAWSAFLLRLALLFIG